MININFLLDSDTRFVAGFKILNRNGDTIMTLNGNFDNADTIRTRRVPLNSALGNDIIRGVVQADPNIIANALNDYDGNLSAFYAVINLEGVNGAQIRANALLSKSGKTVVSLLDKKGRVSNKRTYVKPTTLAKRYKINRMVNRLPFSNYENNDSGDVNCVLHYFLTHHKRISKNKLKKAFGDGADIEKLTSFVEGHNLNTVLVNFNGRVLYHYDGDKKKKCVYAMIADNHFYPLKGTLSKFTPVTIQSKFNNDVIEGDTLEKELPTDMIMINKDSTYYTPDGVYTPYDFEMDETFMDNMRINYTHTGDINSLSCLLFVNNKKIKDMKYEYDLNSAYTNICTDWSSDEIVGVFSCFDMWKKFNNASRILNKSHYSISKTALKRIRPFGVCDNVMDGYQLNLLLDKQYLSTDDIEYVKKPSEHKKFNYYKTKFTNLKEKITKGIEKGTPEYKEKLNQIRIYIGMLGKYKTTNFTSIIGLGREDHDLLNFNCDKEAWKKSDYYDENDCIGSTYTKESNTTKTINGCHIRNYIVSYTNRIMLRNIIHIYETTKRLPLKIVTDGIGYDTEHNLLDSDCDKFKLEVDPKTKFKNKQGLNVKKQELKIYEINVTSKYHDIKQITDDILENIKNKIKHNKTINGCPGTGKTHVMNAARPKIYDMCGTITNMCKRNMDKNAQTLYSMLLQHPATRNRLYNIHKRLKFRRIWIDEFSMIPNQYWNILFDSCMYYYTTLFLTGDINQIAPIGCNKINLNNPIVKLLFGDVETLTKDYRNDAGIIKIRDDVLNGHGVPALTQQPHDDCTNNIVLTHVMRRYINLKVLKKRNETFEYKDGFISASIGCTIKSRSNLRDLNIFKNEMYIVKSKTKDIWTLENKYYKQQVDISKKDMNNFDIGYANTYHSTQGLTFKEKFCLHEVTRAYNWDPSILYTGITRGTTINNISLYDTEHKCNGCEECTYKLPILQNFET